MFIDEICQKISYEFKKYGAPFYPNEPQWDPNEPKWYPMHPNDTLCYLMIPPKNISFLEQLFHQQFVLKLNVKKVVNNIFCKIL